MNSPKKPSQNMFVDDSDIDTSTSTPTADASEALSAGTIIDLPSKGVLGYPSAVSYRDILVKDEEVLSGATQATLLRTINSALKGILNDCSFFEKISVHDRDYILMWIWANTYTSKKYVDVTCSNSKCKHKERMEIDLTKVPVTDINKEIKSPLSIPIGDGKTIDVRPSTIGDEITVETYLAEKEKFSEAEMERLLMIASIDIGFNISFDMKVKWVSENISSTVFGYVRRYHQYFKYGVSDQVEYKCPKCGEVTSVAVPFQIIDVLYPELPNDFERFL